MRRRLGGSVDSVDSGIARLSLVLKGNLAIALFRLMYAVTWIASESQSYGVDDVQLHPPSRKTKTYSTVVSEKPCELQSEWCDATHWICS